MPIVGWKISETIWQFLQLEFGMPIEVNMRHIFDYRRRVPSSKKTPPSIAQYFGQIPFSPPPPIN